LLFVERSNRTERLLEGLAQRLMAPGRHPLAPGVVVVQGPGMERWIAQSIARDYGVCANTDFPFPRGFLEQVFSAIPDESLAKPSSGWEVRNLTWRIAKRLVEGRDDPDFAPLARHLHAVDGDWRLVQLSHRIANLLDHYITFRPDWISAWTSSSTLPDERDERWQARLLREMVAELGRGHVADRALAFQECVASADRPNVELRLQSEFPGAIEIFAVSTLPPLYLSVISGLARIRDVHLSVLSPSRHYWADLWSEIKDDHSVSSSSGGNDSVFDAGLATPAASLLAGLGRLGSDFQRNLEQEPELQDGEADLFEAPAAQVESPSLLARFQTRLLELDDGGGEASDRIVMREDDSIRVHVCHGARRELEVVLATLREAFDRDETLLPEDVIVMAPKIDEIAPDIEAVFGVSADDANGIPYRIADRGVFRRSPVAEAFRNLLELLGGRAARSEVLDWLAREPVRERFGLEESGVERLSDWAERAGIRFGLDEEHREALGLPHERGHTWSGGLDRLALAHAVGACDDIFAGLSPVPLGALGDPEMLGAVGEIESILSEAIQMIRQPRSVAIWCSWLQVMLERTLEQNDSNVHEHATIREVLIELSDSAKASGFEQPIPFEAMRERVADAIESKPSPQPFLSGGVTFCELVPLRAIPFRVIAILGMSDDAFPRGGPAPGFDLIAQHPRPGDRTTRNDDRYLFLEALLSVRDQLIITLPGQDMRDGSTLPASIVVSDFVDGLDSLFDLDADFDAEEGDRCSLAEWLVVTHPLQSTSPRYFETPGDSRLVGRDEEAFSGAMVHRAAIEAGGGSPRRFLVEPSGESEVEPALGAGEPRLTLDELVERFLRSTRFFSREKLQIRLPRPEGATEDFDPVDLDPLLQYGLGSSLLDHLREGATAKEAAGRLIANASMPTGIIGRLSANALRVEVEEVARVGFARCAGERLEDLDFELDLEGVAGLGRCRVVGRLDQLWPGGRIQLGFSKIGRRGELDLWIRHLVLCALVEDGAEVLARSVFVGRADSKKPNDRVVVFEGVDEPRAHLAQIFEWAWSAAISPLPFFPKTAWAFAEKAIAGKSDLAWREAHQKFEGGDSSNFSMPESEEELEYARLWEGWSPLESAGLLPVRYRFEDLAIQFFEPLLAAREVHRE
jgi:exodeoxyribonuclease V gamma subunit